MAAEGKKEWTDEELADAVDRMAVQGEPFDSYGFELMGYVDDLPPGPDRDLAERLQAELRKRREEETNFE